MERKQERLWVKMVTIDMGKFMGRGGWTWKPGHDLIMEENQQTRPEIWLPNALPATYRLGVICLGL